jgi:23S rRNA (uracil1939-C5)-methyltransferase
LRGETVQPGDRFTLELEKVVAGGRALARHEGQIVLVSGGIPGERVTARVTLVRHGVVYADVEDVEVPSPDRRPAQADPACGGMSFSHVAYARQLQLKAAIVVDAFARLARVALDSAPDVHGSQETGYRMRARVHVRDGRLGSFREGTHEICDVRGTRQLLDDTVDVLEEVARRLHAGGVAHVGAIELAESLDADQRVLHVEGARPALEAQALASLASVPGVTGLSVDDGRRERAVAGARWVADDLRRFVEPATGQPSVTLRRHPKAFFQANRYLTPRLAARVIESLGGDPVIDLYAGVGLFALSAVAIGRRGVVAVEGDRVSGEDLRANAAPFGGAVTVVHEAVERVAARGGLRGAGTIVVDPPRTGMSKEAVQGVIEARAERLVYVSCDTATLARDARRLAEHGYRLASLECFDLFPNTPHVESLAVFVR